MERKGETWKREVGEKFVWGYEEDGTPIYSDWEDLPKNLKEFYDMTNYEQS